jgi:hypothetical protein
MMSDAEYREFLDALARKHLRLSQWHRKRFMELDHLSYVLGRLQNDRRLLSVAEHDLDDKELLKLLATRLEHSPIEGVLNDMERCGVFGALEEDPQTLFTNLRRSAIPDEDIDMLRAAGVDDPEAEILLIIHYCRTHLGQGRPNRNLDVLDAVQLAKEAEPALKRAAIQAVSPEQPEHKRKRKVCNGIGKILSGGVLGAGNVLLGCGGIIAPNPAIAYGVIGSCAVAVGSICQGVGDLRGE